MIGGDAQPVARPGRQREHGLGAGREDARHQVRLAVGADDAGRLADELVDAPPALGGRHQRVAGHARVGRVDAAVLRAGVPLVDRGVVLEAGIGRGPRRVGDLVPDVLGGNAAGDLAVGAAGQRPLALPVQHLEEAVGHAHAVVGVLPGDRQVGLAVPVGVVLGEDQLGHALRGELHGLLDVGLGHHRRARLAERGAERGVGLGIGVDPVPDAARGHHRLQPPLAQPRARHQRGDLLLLDRPSSG